MMKVRIFTDGAARGNPEGPGGYGAVLLYTDSSGKVHTKELDRFLAATRLEEVRQFRCAECRPLEAPP